MRLDRLAQELDPQGSLPMALQVAQALTGAIQRGDLQPGEALPGTRPLSETLGVTRHAVLAALRELELEGYVETRHGSGTFVSDRIPHAAIAAHRSESAPTPDLPAFDLSSILTPISAVGQATYDLRGPQPDPRLAPQEALAKAFQRAIRRHGDDLLGAGEPKGNLSLRRELAAFLREHRGLRLDPEQILVTRGLRHGLDLLMEALCPRGGSVGLEVPGPPDLRETLGLHRGVDLVGLPVDGEGIDPANLSPGPARPPLRAVLVRPLAQVPTGAALSGPRRAALLEAAARHRFAVLEDDSGFPFTGSDTPTLPLAAEDPQGSVVYMLSFSRLLAPGLRLGLLAGPRALVDRLARLRRTKEQQGDRVLEWALADLVRDGEVTRALRRHARELELRRTRAEAHLRERFAGQLELRAVQPLGALIQGAEGFDLKAFVGACARQGVRLEAPGAFAPGSGETTTFVGWGCLDAEAWVDALRRMVAASGEGRPTGTLEG